jgi:hypothetical protein
VAAKLPPKKTSDELQIDCEVASAIIADYFAYCAKRLAKEKQSSSPNLDKIKAFESQLLELNREKMALGVDNSDLINKAFYIYAPLLKQAKE